MAQNNVANAEKKIQSAPLTLAAMYLEATLNRGLSIEIPSLGITLSREQTSAPEAHKSLKSAPTMTK